MTLSTGTRLGPYEITGQLGEGGMGEVYRATDSKLKREVAIKVLPAAFTEDKERLAVAGPVSARVRNGEEETAARRKMRRKDVMGRERMENRE